MTVPRGCGGAVLLLGAALLVAAPCCGVQGSRSYSELVETVVGGSSTGCVSWSCPAARRGGVRHMLLSGRGTTHVCAFGPVHIRCSTVLVLQTCGTTLTPRAMVLREVAVAVAGTCCRRSSRRECRAEQRCWEGAFAASLCAAAYLVH